MDVVQVRLPDGVKKGIDKLVAQKLYDTPSDFMRGAARRLLIDSLIGILPEGKESVEEIRILRNKLSKEPLDFSAVRSSRKKLIRHKR